MASPQTAKVHHQGIGFHNKQWPPSDHRSLQLFSWWKFWTGSTLTVRPQSLFKKKSQVCSLVKTGVRRRDVGLLSLATFRYVGPNSTWDGDHSAASQLFSFHRPEHPHLARCSLSSSVIPVPKKASECISKAQLVLMVKEFPLEHYIHYFCSVGCAYICLLATFRLHTHECYPPVIPETCQFRTIFIHNFILKTISWDT